MIRTYIEVRDHPDRSFSEMNEIVHSYRAAADPAAFYYDQRELYNAKLPDVSAGRFLFLNRTCWNGLYRVNRQGRFNVPHGSGKDGDSLFPTFQDLQNASASLQQAQLKAASWRNLIASAKPGDFIFLDPPYYSDVKRDDTKYNRTTFTARDHELLAQHCKIMADRGIDFLLTNSGESEMQALYRSFGFDCELVDVPRAINSKPDGRTAVSEVIVRPKGRSIMSPQLDLHFEG